MSELYQTPAERAKALRESTKTGNWLQDSFTDMVSSGISLNEDGSVDRKGAAWWLQGFTPGAESIAEQKQGLADSRIIDQRVQDSGLTPEQINAASGGKKLTKGNSAGIIASAQRTELNKPTPVQQAEIDRGITQDRNTAKQLANQALEMKLTRQQQGDQFTLQMQRMLQQDKQAAEARLDELALRRMEMEREDMRYNENIARMDRKDRQQSIQTLVAGLANLGAAFAL